MDNYGKSDEKTVTITVTSSSSGETQETYTSTSSWNEGSTEETESATTSTTSSSQEKENKGGFGCMINPQAGFSLDGILCLMIPVLYGLRKRFKYFKKT